MKAILISHKYFDHNPSIKAKLIIGLLSLINYHSSYYFNFLERKKKILFLKFKLFNPF